MKIIKAGKLPAPVKPWWVGVPITCSNCNAQWELEEGDQGPHGLKQEGIHGKPKVICPTHGCDTRVEVPVYRDQGVPVGREFDEAYDPHTRRFDR